MNDIALDELLDHLDVSNEREPRLLEIGCGNGQRAESLASEHPDWHVIATDWSAERPETISNASYLRQDVHDLAFRDDYFDAVYSVAVSEHYQDTALALREQFRVLKPGGIFYFIHTPFFSCSRGHHAHYRPMQELFPMYGHLYMEEEEFVAESLRNRQERGLTSEYREQDVRNIIAGIYGREDLSRVFYEDFKAIFEQTPFEILQWKVFADPSFDEAAAEAALHRIDGMTGVPEMKIEKLRCAARKPRR